MSEILIIGGGIAGLALGKRLTDLNVPWRGFERENKIGGRLETGHHRVYTSDGRDFLSDLWPTIEWLTVDEAPKQIRKGEWEDAPQDLRAPEQFYLGHPYFYPKSSYSVLLAHLEKQVGAKFELRSRITHIDLQKRTATGLNGVEHVFERMVWTSSLASLAKITGQTPKGLAKKKPAALETGGVTWDIRVSEPLFSESGTVVFPFRYKDLKVRAIGVRAPWNEGEGHIYHWMIFLEDALLDDHEELAKIVRAFKRELTKQFPALEGHLIQEKLAFHPSLSGEVPVSAASLEVFEGVACVGPDIFTEEVKQDGDTSARRNLDTVARNCMDFLDLVLPQWQAKPLPTPQPILDSGIEPSLSA